MGHVGRGEVMLGHRHGKVGFDFGWILKGF